MSGLKLGILRLGRVAGKTKYALIDERDISIVQQHAIEPRIEVDKNGNGARIYAIAHDIGKGRNHGKYLHDLLWERHRGGIAPGWHIAHRNHITVDNRLDNLQLMPDHPHHQRQHQHSDHHHPALGAVGSMGAPSTSCGGVEEEEMGLQGGEGFSSHSNKSRENSLYWITVSQLLGDPQEMNYLHTNKWYDLNGDIVDTAGDSYMYYECHFPPCTRMEREVREFSICGRCHEVRYCGTSCQERDWSSHKRFCRHRYRQTRESSPER